MGRIVRDPADWARDAGWVSRRKAENAAVKLCNLADGIEGALWGDEGGMTWAREIRQVAKALAPKKVAAMREP